MDELSLAQMSVWLSQVLDDVGVSEKMIVMRRRTFLQSEAINTVSKLLMDQKITTYHFGSMTEGTTTIGMGSDLDTLDCDHSFEVILDYGDWRKKDSTMYVLMVNDEKFPPGYCSLQIIKSDSAEPLQDKDGLSKDIQNYCVQQKDKTILLTNTISELELEEFYRKEGFELIKQGPSRTWSKDFDNVTAFPCEKTPAAIEEWIEKKRLCRWPTEEMLKEAEQLECFVVPRGYPGHENQIVQWMISPNLIERMLMFSLNIVQLKTYVVLKLIKTCLFHKNVSDNITSFHIKTALLWTIERLPFHIWTNKNLLVCVKRCLSTLLHFVIDRFCPHYIFPKLNLFIGKLGEHDLIKLDLCIRQMLLSDLSWLFKLSTDNIGQRLQMLFDQEVQQCTYIYSRLENRNDIEKRLAGKFMNNLLFKWSNVILVEILNFLCNKYPCVTELSLGLSVCLQTCMEVAEHGTELEQRVAKQWIPHLCATASSLLASVCFNAEEPFPKVVLATFFQSMEGADAVSCILKFASVLYCANEFNNAADLLHDVELRYEKFDIQQVCGCARNIDELTLKHSFCEHALSNPEEDIERVIVAYCVRFIRQEEKSVPNFLVYEMYRSIGDDVPFRTFLANHWTDWAVVDPLPFLYYLQFLVYDALGIDDLQTKAFKNLIACFYGIDIAPTLFHRETALNLLGHCIEIQEARMYGTVNLALATFAYSLCYMPRNNAANWHVARLYYIQLLRLYKAAMITVDVWRSRHLHSQRNMDGSRGGRGSGPPGKLQVAIGFP